MSGRLKRILFISLLTAIVLFLIKLFAFDFYIIEQMSMYKSISKGDQVIISKYSRNKVGDIILYEDENSEDVRISRLVAKTGDIVQLRDQELYLNNKVVKYKDVTYSYCLRFIKDIEKDSFENRYLISKINNSGFFQVELTDTEYENIINDSLSELRSKLVPIKNCRYNIFSESNTYFKITIPADSVFILNDNRSDLFDSRTFGLIPTDKIIGKVIYVYQ